MVCVFPMAVIAILPHAEFGPNDHWEGATLFRFLRTRSWEHTRNIPEIRYIDHWVTSPYSIVFLICSRPTYSSQIDHTRFWSSNWCGRYTSILLTRRKMACSYFCSSSSNHGTVFGHWVHHVVKYSTMTKCSAEISRFWFVQNRPIGKP